MIKAVIYARYSSYAQGEQSIEGQLRDCQAYAVREDYHIINEYVDRALTGRSDERPDFQRMIADAAKKQFDVVIVWKLDRFARNRYDSAMYRAKLKKHGVRVVSVMEHISDGPEGIMMEGLLESMAEYYSVNLSQNIRRGMKESVIKGTYLGCPVPIGFKVVNKKLVADEKTAPIIRYAFKEYSLGTPKKDIIQELNRRGMRTSTGKELTLASLQKALRNEKYIGIYRYNGELVNGGCEAIVENETFEKVQAKLDAVRHAPAASKAKVDYFLQGKAFCGMCGSRLVGESGHGKGGTTYHYYACTNRKKLHICAKKNEKKGFLEWYVVEQTAEYVLSPARLDYIAERLASEYAKEFGVGRIKEYERLIKKLEREINNAVEASLELPNREVRKPFLAKIEQSTLQKQELEGELASLRLASRIPMSATEIRVLLKRFCDGDPLDSDYQQRIIDTFINSVYVYDDKVVIYYNIEGAKQVSYIEMLDSANEPGFSDDEVSDGVRISNAMLHHLKG